MCVDKKDFRELSEAVSQVKHDTGNIRQTQETLGFSIAEIEEQLKTLNGKTARLESRTTNLEDPEFKTVRCIQKDVIKKIGESMLTVQKFEEWEDKKAKDKEKDAALRMHTELVAVKHLEARQRKMQWIVTAIVGTGTVVMSLIAYFI